MTKAELELRIERNRQLIGLLETRRNNIQNQINQLNRKILNQENALMNLPDEEGKKPKTTKKSQGKGGKSSQKELA